MQLIRGLHNLRDEHRGCVATIGNFDGVHLGHQSVFASLTMRARSLGLASLVITFEPQPMEFFRPDEAPPRLTRLREKLEDEWDADPKGDAAARDAFIEAGMRDYDRGLRRRLIWLVYIIPALLILLLIYFTNFS